MLRTARSLALFAASAALLLCASVSASDRNDEADTAPSGEAMALDLLIMRPLSLAGTVLGTAIFIVATPFNLITLNFKDPARRLVLEPAEYTFTRKLGDLD